MKTGNNQAPVIRLRLDVIVTTIFIILCGLVQAKNQFQKSNRESVTFNLDWKYKKGDASGAENPSFNDASWEDVVIPHSTKWVTPEDLEAYIGISWYRKQFALDEKYQGKKIFIEFEAAMQFAEVWINGTKKIAHEGGYMGFTIDITDNVSFSSTKNVVAVKVNSIHNEKWAPGRDKVDFNYHGGLYRDVNCYVTDKLHITDALFANKVAGGGIFITYPSVSSSSATVNVKTHVVNGYTASKNCKLVSEIVDAQGSVVQSATKDKSIEAGKDHTFNQNLVVSNPKLWHPHSPNLYTLRTKVKDGNTLVDHYNTRIGIRSIKWTHSNGVLINGKSFKAYGGNVHQDIYGLGNAIPKKAIYYDLKRFRESGMDFVRAAHYPHSSAFYDACDELGILVMNAITGWQFFKNTAAFKNNSYKEIREMIRRDRNHASVVLWETSLNESRFNKQWADNAHKYGHEEYPGDQMFTCGWSSNFSSTPTKVVFDVMIGASQHNIRDNQTTQPVMVCEYGHWDYGGHSSTSNVAREAADAPLLVQCDNHQDGHNKNRALKWYAADAVWEYSDHSGKNPVCGVIDYYRIPKFSYYFYQSQRDPNFVSPTFNSGPMIYIANRWTTSSPTKVRVFSNCNRVSLYLNGSLIETRQPDTGPTCGSLLHPPFTFSLSSFTAGELKAVGLIGGQEKATHIRKTPQVKVALKLRAENDTLLADGSDARLVWVDVVDANGTVVPTDNSSVSLSISGPGTILGPNTISMKGGQLATWIRSKTTMGTITLTARSSQLTTATLNLYAGVATSIKFVKPVVPSAPISTLVIPMFGTSIKLPHQLKGKMKTIRLYTLAGRLVYTTSTKTNNITIQKQMPLSSAIYVAKIELLQKKKLTQ